jgi:hypothetical protein
VLEDRERKVNESAKQLSFFYWANIYEGRAKQEKVIVQTSYANIFLKQLV